MSSWNFARDSVSSRWSGPSLVAVMNGRLTVVSCSDESSIFAFSAASLRRCDGHLVGREVDAVRVLELAHQPVDDALVPVVATEVRVAGGRLDLEDALAEVEDRHVERAAAEVEHEDGLVALLVEPVRERGGGGLVDDAQHLEARDLAGLLGGLALGVAEVRGDGDDGLRDGVAEVGLGVALELLEDAGRDLLRVVRLAVDVDRPVGAHVALHRADRAIRVGDRLALRDLADEHLAGLRERDDRRGRARPLGVGDDDGLARLEDRDDGVGGAEVDADGLGHGECLLVGSLRWDWVWTVVGSGQPRADREP